MASHESGRVSFAERRSGCPIGSGSDPPRADSPSQDREASFSVARLIFETSFCRAEITHAHGAKPHVLAA
jgi:hypothetical protein